MSRAKIDVSNFQLAFSVAPETTAKARGSDYTYHFDGFHQWDPHDLAILDSDHIRRSLGSRFEQRIDGFNTLQSRLVHAKNVIL